jgi:hypothetical protein
MSEDGQPGAADIELVMMDLGTTSSRQAPSEVRVGTIRLRGWQVRPVGPLPGSRQSCDGYLIKAGYDVAVAQQGHPLSWFEIGFAFGEASVVDVLPRTLVDPQPPSCYVLNDSLHFVVSDRPEVVHLPATAPVVDVFGLGGREIRWRRLGGVQSSSYTAWMMVLAPAGSTRLTVNVTVRYEMSTVDALEFRPIARPWRFDLNLAACQGMVDLKPVTQTSCRTELVAFGTMRVLITYAHDSSSHVQAVLRFGELLCERGIDTHLDRWDADDRQDWNLWALDNITKADFVLVVASPRCKAAGDGQAESNADRGLRSALSILRDRLMEDRVTWLPKILSVVLPGCSADDIPLFLNSRYTGHYPVGSFTLSGVDSFLRTLTKRPRYERPSVTTRIVQLGRPAVDAALGDLDMG